MKSKRVLLPVLIVAAAVPLFALAETLLAHLPVVVGESSEPFWRSFRRMLGPWAELAALMPVVLLLARRLPLGGPAAIRNGAVHLFASLAIGATHLFLDVLIWGFVTPEPQRIFKLTALLISRYMLQDVFLYWTVVGGLQLFWKQRTLRERELLEARLEADLAAARLAALQARLEPHFLFNTLNTAVMMVRNDDREQAVEVLLELSELLREVVRSGPDREVRLGEEWEFVRRYLALEQTRFPERLKVEYEFEPALGSVPIPFLILQPLVENALRHGVARQNGEGRLRLRAERCGGALRLSVRDNGPGPDAGPAREGVGLASVRGRLRERYGPAAVLSLLALPEGGTEAAILLPLG